MPNTLSYKNPFAVTTPENLSDDEVFTLFVDVFSDFPKIINPNHTFIHGARGTGKSMMLRYLEPLVQMKANQVNSPEELDFFAVHIPIKASNLSKVEFSRFSGAPYFLLAEHMLVLHCAIRILESLQKVCLSHCADDEIKIFYIDFLQGHLLQKKKKNIPPSDCSSYFLKIISELELIYNNTQQYIAQHAFKKTISPYKDRLLGWLDFLVPFVKEILNLPFMPSGPLFLMLDDADNLDANMQRVLNTWVASRVTDCVCLKITTQMRYATYETMLGNLIEAPHDYSDVDITKVYSSKTTNFYDRAKAITQKRIALLGLEEDISPEDFFPVDAEQEARIAEIAAELKAAHSRGEGRAARVSDDVTRYARPEYIRRLERSAHSYSYAGFKSLVDLSSGIIRWFLEPASTMYSECKSKNESADVSFIPASIQDQIIKNWSSKFYEEELKKIEISIDKKQTSSNTVAKLKNLIDGVGMLFQRVLKTEKLSERRLFNFMLTEEPEGELEQVLELGVQHGYFFRSSVGSKEGYGRNIRFSLSRRLGPYYKLDVSGFAGNLSVTPADLHLALKDPGAFVRVRFKKLETSTKNDGQHSLLDLE